MYNVLIQPFHCLLFMVFISTAINALNGTLASGIFAIVVIMFLNQAEGIIKKMFGFSSAGTLGDALRSFAAIRGATSMITKIGSNVGNKIKEGGSDKAGSGAAPSGNTAQGNATQGSDGNSSNDTGDASQDNEANAPSTQSNQGGIRGTYRRFRNSKAGKVAAFVGKGYAKAAKYAFAAGVGALGAGTGNLRESVTIATGIKGAVDNIEGGVKARRYAMALNSDLNLAGDQYEAMRQKFIEEHGGDEQKGTAAANAKMHELLNKNIKNIEDEYKGTATNVKRAVNLAEKLGKDKQWIYEQVTGSKY